MAHAETYPVQDRRPSLHSYALEDSEHGKADVIKIGDPMIGAIPGIEARWGVGIAYKASRRCGCRVVCIARCLRFPLFHDYR